MAPLATWSSSELVKESFSKKSIIWLKCWIGNSLLRIFGLKTAKPWGIAFFYFYVSTNWFNSTFLAKPEKGLFCPIGFVPIRIGWGKLYHFTPRTLLILDFMSHEMYTHKWYLATGIFVLSQILFKMKGFEIGEMEV